MDNTELEGVLRRVEGAIDEKDFALIRALFQSYSYVADLVEDKNTSIRRLRQLFFGKRTEKTKDIVENGAEKSATPPEANPSKPGPQGDAGKPEQRQTEPAPIAKGHGRNGAEVYRGAERIAVPLSSLKAGNACPACGEGIVYTKAPGLLVRIIGQPPLTAKIYELQKLRCHLCGEVFTAEPPAEAGERKYDATAGSMIGLLKYGSGMPFNRLDGLQGHLEMPLPASTQWDIVQAVAKNLAPVFDELVRQAAE